MKKYLYLMSFLLVAFNSNAQNVPNGGFENWTNFTGYSTPNSWHTTDSLASSQFGQRSVLQETVDIHGGASAMKLQTWILFGTQPMTGAASNGIINTSTFAVEGGTSNTTRHNMLTGWYKYIPNSDSCSVSVTMTRWNGNARVTVGSGRWMEKNTVSSYTQFTLPINYVLAGNPDTVLIVIASGTIGLGTAHAGTLLFIDDLNFSGVNVSSNDLPSNNFALNVFPNPASNFLTIESKWNAGLKWSVSILDINGKLLQNVALTDNRQRIDINALVNGNYFYDLVDENGVKLTSGKFSVNR